MKKFLIAVVCLGAVQELRPQSIQTAADLMTCQPGWDIYKAGTYRYGPSFIINDDGSIDAWFAASGDSYGDMYYKSSTTQSALQIKTVKSVGQCFEAKDDFHRVSICCPTWSRPTGERVIISVYQWRVSYKVSMQYEPLYTKQIEMTDNMWIDAFYSAEAETDPSIRFPAGKYLWVLSEPSDYAGVWYYAQGKASSHSSTQAFQNGNKVDGSYMMVTQSHAGATSYWDCPTYQKSTNGGKSWSREVKALTPDQGTRDELSACDPGVVKYGGYYYLGYTSTENTAGVDNHLYMARSTSPTGPWEKWNGEGWGGSPQPVITYTGNHSKWGCGEPCMVILNGTLYLYYSWNDTGTTTTRLATANADDENWPASLRRVGTVIDKSSIPAADHCDIKYCDDIGMFIAVHTAKRMTADAYVNVWVSADGRTFRDIGKLEGTTQPGLHNCGITGDAQGHIQLSRPQFIAYAYGIGTWGKWNTHLQPLQFSEALMTIIEECREQETDKVSYDLRGMRIAHSVKGIYIKEGKKVLER
ncbi:MAG: hypothetical protein IJR87_00590 [Bacteroidaceae bacterium]|nr:hypothetical protein [Bacteroidaceae bacterium]